MSVSGLFLDIKFCYNLRSILSRRLTMDIRATASRSEKGDFKAEIKDNALYIAEDIFAELKRAYVSGLDVDIFIVYLRMFPLEFTEAMKWNMSDLEEAEKKLFKLLESFVKPDLLYPAPTFNRIHGPVAPHP